MVNKSGELVRLTEDDLMMNACALSEAAAMATAAAALASAPVPAPAPSPAPARAPAPLTETSAATAPAIGKAYSSDVTGDGPAPGERVHHLTVEAAEDAACAAVDAAAAAGGRKSKRPPFRRHTQALASHASGRLGEATCSAGKMQRNDAARRNLLDLHMV